MDDGALIRVRLHGNPDGLRLVLSHGNGFAADAYYPFWRPLAEHCEIVLFDIRNYGHNPFHGAAGHNSSRFVKDLDLIGRAVADAFGDKVSVGVFHSLSARINLKRAVEAGPLWDAMVVFDPPMVPPPDHRLYAPSVAEERTLSRWARTRRNRFSDPSGLARLYRENRAFRRWVPGAHELAARSVLRLDEATGEWALACPGELEARIYGENTEMELWPPPAAFDRPLKFIASDSAAADAKSPGLCCKALGDEYGHVYEAIPDTGHFLQIEKPEACARAMFSFLADIGIRA